MKIHYIRKESATQSSTSITATGSGTGFWRYYSNSVVGTRSIAATSCGKYITNMINRVTKEATPALQKHINEVVTDLQDIQEFESYAWGDCDNMVNTVNYNKGSGTLFLYVYTFSPFIHPTRGEGVKIQSMRITANMELAKDWMVVSKVKASFFKTTMSQEIQYIPQKGIELKHVVEAIAMAMAPAVLGLVQLPERFMTVLDTLLKDQMANPDKGVVTAPTKEQTEFAYNQFKDMQTKQDEYEKNAQEGFADIQKVLGQNGIEGTKGTETAAPQ